MLSARFVSRAAFTQRREQMSCAHLATTRLHYLCGAIITSSLSCVPYLPECACSADAIDLIRLLRHFCIVLFLPTHLTSQHILSIHLPITLLTS